MRAKMPRMESHLPAPIVVIDTNAIVHRDWRLQQTWWRLLLELSAIGRITLVVPEVVLREAVGKYARKAKAVSKDLTQLQLTFDLEQSVASYEAELRNKLKDANCRIDGSPPIGVLELTDRAVARKRPFNDEGNGFRDTLIWMHVLELASAGEEVHFVSSDSGFHTGKGTDRRLKSELAEEARASDGTVNWHYELGDLLTVLGRDPGDSAVSEAEIQVLALLRRDLTPLLDGLEDTATNARLIVDEEQTASTRIQRFLPPMRVLDLKAVRYPDSIDAGDGFYVSMQCSGGIRVQTVLQRHEDFNLVDVVDLPDKVFWVSAHFEGGELGPFDLDPIELSSSELTSTISIDLSRRKIHNPLEELTKQLNEGLIAQLNPLEELTKQLNEGLIAQLNPLEELTKQLNEGLIAQLNPLEGSATLFDEEE